MLTALLILANIQIFIILMAIPSKSTENIDSKIDKTISEIRSLKEQIEIMNNNNIKYGNFLEKNIKLSQETKDYQRYLYKMGISLYKDKFLENIYNQYPQLIFQEDDSKEELISKQNFVEKLWSDHSYNLIHKDI